VQLTTGAEDDEKQQVETDWGSSQDKMEEILWGVRLTTYANENMAFVLEEEWDFLVHGQKLNYLKNQFERTTEALKLNIGPMQACLISKYGAIIRQNAHKK
jgi:hypothetical protein